MHVLRFLVLAILLATASGRAGTPDTVSTLPTQGSSFFSQLTTFLKNELAEQFSEWAGSFVASGCLGATAAGLSHTPSSCIAYAGGYRVTETGAITYSNNQTCWAIVHKDTTGNLATNATFTRVSGTHYLINCTTSTQPTLPDDSAWLMKVVTSGGAITAVTDLRRSTGLAFLSGMPVYDRGGQVYNVKAWPWLAVGDGSTNDTTAVTSAIAAIPSGGIIFFPPGTYALDPITITTAQIKLRGMGRGVSILKKRSSGTMITVSNVGGFEVEDLTLHGNGGTYTGDTLRFTGSEASDARVLNVSITNQQAYAIRFGCGAGSRIDVRDSLIASQSGTTDNIYMASVSECAAAFCTGSGQATLSNGIVVSASCCTGAGTGDSTCGEFSALGDRAVVRRFTNLDFVGEPFGTLGASAGPTYITNCYLNTITTTSESRGFYLIGNRIRAASGTWDINGQFFMLTNNGIGNSVTINSAAQYCALMGNVIAGTFTDNSITDATSGGCQAVNRPSSTAGIQASMIGPIRCRDGALNDQCRFQRPDNGGAALELKNGTTNSYQNTVDFYNSAGSTKLASLTNSTRWRSIPPANQVIAAGNSVTADACGTIKNISSASPVTTSGSNTFTAPSSSNEGCVMHVCNTGGNAITLDKNSNFMTDGGLDVVLSGAHYCVTVVSDGSVWRQVSAVLAGS